jgi:hypothetical protein
VVQVSSNEAQVYERLFYDAACTALWQDIFLDVVATSSTTAAVAGADIAYTTAGAQYDYETLVFAISGIGTGSGEFALKFTDAAATNAPERVALGVACNVAGQTSLGCGFGAVAHLSPIAEDVAALVNVNASVASVGSGVVNVPVSGNASGYVSGLNALGLTTGSTFPNWAISGGSAFDTETLVGQLSYSISTGALVGGTLTVADAADDGTVTVSAGGSPAQINGSVNRTSTGQVVATFTLDVAGNGTVTYSNGSTAQIVGWAVLG